MKTGAGHARAPAPTPSEPAPPPARAREAPNALWDRLALRGPGEPLPDDVRATMEARFGGRDFGRVRVHTGPDAAASADALDARAYTVGRHVVFGAGRFAPATSDGTHLLAHELAHVAQQDGAADAAAGESLGTLPLTRPGGVAERSADAAATAVMRGDAPRTLPSTGLAVARQPKTEPAPPPVAPGKHSEQKIVVQNGSIEETIDAETATDEQGRPRGKTKLVYRRTVRVKMPGEFWAEMRVEGTLFVPFAAPDAQPAQLLAVPGTGWYSAYVHVDDERGPTTAWHGFDFVGHRATGGYAPANDYTSLWTMAARGPAYVHVGLTPDVQIDALIEEVRRRLPPRKPKPKDVTEDEFRRMTPDEKAELAHDALAEEFQWSNVAKAIGVGLLVAGAALGAIALASVGGEALAIGLAIAAVLAGLFALFSLLWDTISDALERFADSDIGGAILKILGGLAALGALILGGYAVVMAILGAPLEVAGALALAGLALLFGLILAYHDYDQAKSAPDLAHFRKDIQRSARGFEGAISDAVLTFLAMLLGGGKRPARGTTAQPAPSAPAPGQLPSLTPPQPPEPVIIEPPRIVPAPPEIEIPQVAPAAPPVPDIPQVAGPSVMVPATGPEVVELPAIPRVLQLPDYMQRLPRYMQEERLQNPPAIDPARTDRMRDALRAQRAQPGVPGRVDPPASPGVPVVGGTRAIAQTDIPTLEGMDFTGASPRALPPGQAGAPGTTGGTVLRPAYPRAVDHAEHVAIENVRVAIEEGLARAPGEPGAISRADLRGRTVYVLVEQEPCSSCAAGTGVLQQFSALFPELIVEVRSLRTSRAYIYGGGMLLNP